MYYLRLRKGYDATPFRLEGQTVKSWMTTLKRHPELGTFETVAVKPPHPK
jgi:hypothetical protein